MGSSSPKNGSPHSRKAPPETAWRQKDDAVQGLLQDASSGIIDSWRFLARESNLPFRDNTTASHGLIAITTLVRYLNGDLQAYMRSHKKVVESA